MPSPEELAKQEQERREASDRIIRSKSPKRLIVVGPGAGKSFTFQRAFNFVDRHAAVAGSEVRRPRKVTTTSHG